MGCDIHVMVEVNKNGKWVNANPYKKDKNGQFELQYAYFGRGIVKDIFSNNGYSDEYPEITDRECFDKEHNDLSEEVKDFLTKTDEWDGVGIFGHCTINMISVYLKYIKYPKLVDYNMEWPENWRESLNGENKEIRPTYDNPLGEFITRIEQTVFLGSDFEVWEDSDWMNVRLVVWFDN